MKKPRFSGFSVGDRVKCYYTSGRPRTIGTITEVYPGAHIIVKVTEESVGVCKVWRIGMELCHLANQGRVTRLVPKKKTSGAT